MNWHRWVWALALVAGLLGMVHVALTPLAYRGWTIEALWFVGTGFAMLIAALANVLSLSSIDRRGRILGIVINVMMAGFFAAAWFVLPGPQVIVGGVVFVCLVALQARKPVQLAKS
jgi:hypothetical protein